MTVHQPIAQFEEMLRPATPLRRNRGERTFDLHPAIHALTAGAYLAFVGILSAAFMGPDLIVPTAIFVIGVIALFATPALWTRVAPDDGVRKQSWGEFMAEGVECLTGMLTARQALAQILVLPALMVALALVFAIIRATL